MVQIRSTSAVRNVENKFSELKFKELKLGEKWDLQKCGKYYVKINGSAIFGFVIGGKVNDRTGFTIIASHTDSPCLRLKPNSCFKKNGYNMVGVQTYGGGIWHTWMDRDLGLAGKVVVKESSSIRSKLVFINRPLMRVPELAIHLNRKVNESLQINTETDLVPILSLTDGCSQENCIDALLASELKIPVENILSSDILLVDCNTPVIGGSNSEFLFAPRLDNLFNVYCSMQALIDSLQIDNLQSTSVDTDEYVRMLLCYDNEEVGSESYQGAESNVVKNILKRICDNIGCDYMVAVSKSFVVSADQAHATHPNFADKHESQHKIDLKGGVVIKINDNQRYATTCFTTAMVELVAQRHSLPTQKFVVRNDMPCGSTVGPIISALLGIRTVDIGFPMLSMHSIREVCACISADQAISFYTACFKEIPNIMMSIVES